MSKIFATCPVTGQMIYTGIEIEGGTFFRLPTFVGKIYCPHCNTEHEWSKATAKAVDEDDSAKS